MLDISEIARALGVTLAEGTAATPAGQHRSVFATTDRGVGVVVKWSRDGGWSGWLPTALRLSEDLRARGYPAPRVVAHGPVPAAGYAVILERLEGEPCLDGLDASLLRQVMAAIELQAEAHVPDGAVVDGWSWVAAVVHEDHAGWWRAARALGDEVADLCDELSAWVAAVPRAELRTDYVHLDLNTTNILASRGTLSGIVDLDHLGIGDRCVDLAHLWVEHVWIRHRTGAVPHPDLFDLVREAIVRIGGEPGWREAICYNAISSLGWSGPDGLRVPLDQAIAGARAALQA